MEFQVFRKGTKIAQFVGSQTGIMLNLDEYGGTLFFIIDEKHLNQYKLGGHYDFWCVKISDVIFFGVKLGQNPHAAAPFTPYLSPKYTSIHFEEGKGMPLRIVLVSNADGVVKDFDFLVLGNRISNKLMDFCEEIRKKPFDRNGFQYTIQEIYRLCPSDEYITCLAECTYSID